MTHKSARIAQQVARFEGRGLDPRYLGYFELFNQGRFYEAHDVLEDLWLVDRRGPDGDFYKALIQLAGAFVHLQKGRLTPGAALLRLAGQYLRGYPEVHHDLDLGRVLGLVEEWVDRVDRRSAGATPAEPWSYPKLELRPGAPGGDGPAGLKS